MDSHAPAPPTSAPPNGDSPRRPARPGGLSGRLVATALALLTAASAVAIAPLTVQGSTSAYAAQVLADGPAGYWRLGEQAGATAVDATRHAGGAYRYHPTLGRTGLQRGDGDTSVRFDGINDDVAIPSRRALSPTGAITVEAWIRARRLPASGAWASVVTKHNSWSIQFAGRQLEFTIVQAGVRRRLRAAAGTIATGTTYHVAGSYDGRRMRLYVNGSLVASRRLSGLISRTTNRVTIGSRNGRQHFAGVIDEVAVYTRAVSGTRLAAHRTAARQGVAKPTPTAIPTPSDTATSTPAPTFTTPTPTATATATPTPSAAPSTSATPTATPPPAPTPTATPLPTAPPSPTAPPTATPRPSATPTPTSPPSGFIGRSGTSLTLNGEAFRFDGMNIPQAIQAPCWFRSDLQTGLTSIGSGQEVIRVFALQRTATTNGARDWQYVDAMLATLRGHGQRAILVLTDQWKGQPCTDSTTNRTLSWYQTGYRSTVEGVTTYRDWVAQIVTRYRNDPTVAFWQLVNEADARNGDGSCSETTARTALRAFADDVAGLIKSIDGNHLVSLGTTPGQCGSNEADFAAVHAGPDIDICDYHDYRYPYSPMGNTDAWNGVQVSIDRCRALGKPLFMGELGMGFSSLSTPTTAYRATLFDAKLAAQFKAGSVGELFWTWSNTFSSTPPRDMEIAPGDPALGLIGKY